jgi:hypothetical protein
MEKEQVAESLLATTRSDKFPWKTHTVKQVFSNGGKGTDLRHGIGPADHPPAKGFHRVGSSTLHTRFIAQKEERTYSALVMRESEAAAAWSRRRFNEALGTAAASVQPPQPPAPEPLAVISEFSSSPASLDWHTPSYAMIGTPPVDPVAAGAPSLAATASPASWPSPKEAQLVASRRELVRNRSNEEAPDAKQSRGNTDS